MTEPLKEAEQDEIFRIADTMDSNMALNLAACVAATNPDVDAQALFEVWLKKFRENTKKVMAMSPEEYKAHRAHQEELENKERLERELERAKRKLHDARWILRRVQDAARKAGIL